MDAPINHPATATKMSPTAEDIIKGLLLSRSMRKSSRPYPLKFKERELLLLLIEDSLDVGLLNGAPVRLEEWAKTMGGLRIDKLRPIFDTLKDSGMVDLDPATGFFNLRPSPASWLPMPGFVAVAAQTELNLCADRPLSVTLTGLSQESALAGGPALIGWSALSKGYEAVRAAIEQAAPAIPQASKHRENPPSPVPAEKSAGVAVPSKAEQFSLRIAGALNWIEGIDLKGDMQVPKFREFWDALCRRNPHYVLNRLRGIYEDNQKRVAKGEPVSDYSTDRGPLAVLSSIARREGQIPFPKSAAATVHGVRA
jgi:hypothetical protein